MSGSGETGLRLAVLGASGILGSQLLELIDERAFSYGKLALFRTSSEADDSVEIGGRSLAVTELAGPEELSDFDLVFLAVPRGPAQEIIDALSGPVVVDFSAETTAPGAVPLVAPGFTARERVRELARGGILRIPHPAALALATICQALGKIPFCAATILLSASGGVQTTIRELVEQSADLLNGRLDLEDDETQTAFNAAPLAAGELAEILLMQAGQLLGRKLDMALQVIQVPVLHGTAITIGMPGADADRRERLRGAPGVLLVEDEAPPSVVDAIGQEALLITVEPAGTGQGLWCAFDNARNAALSAVWIAECLLPAGDKKLS